MHFLSYKLQIKPRLFRINPFMCIKSIIITSLYLHNFVYIPLVIMIFTIFSYFFKMHYRTEAGVPKYFEDYCTMPSCNSVLKELIQATVQHTG